ncbi:MAG: RIP metalloprotease RseP [Bacillota bacterium]
MVETAVTTTLAFAFVFATFALSHEFGHFAVGKAAGIKVYEFALGFGPLIARIRRGETTYSLRALPMGAFVKFAGLDRPDNPQDDVDATDPRSFRNKALAWRIATILAGPVMNFVTAFLFFVTVFVAVGVPTAIVAEVYPGTPAQAAGLQAGDRIVAINRTSTETVAEARDIISANPGRRITITIERDGTRLKSPVTPGRDPETGRGIIGVMLSEPWQPTGVARAVRTGVAFTTDTARTLVVSLGRMITGKIKPEVAGPIGIAQVVGQTARLGMVNLLYLAALLNVNLGLLNLLPIPVLDGGWIVLLGIEAARRRPLNAAQEAFARMVGIAILALLIAFATLSDIARLGGLIG